MGKIVGKVWIWLTLFSVQWIIGTLSLRTLNMDRMPLLQAGAGHPFLVEISVSDTQAIGQSPVIQGLEQFTVKNTGVHITSVNNKTSATYLFEVRIDTPGTFTIGPAILPDRNGQLRSNTAQVIVGKQEHVDTKNIRNSKQSTVPILLRLYADKDQAFVGERVHCRLRFYNTDPSISLQRFIEQESKEMHRKKAQGPHEGAERLNDIDYRYVEWEWDIFPQKAGQHIIPAYGADYEREIERDNVWGSLGRFLGNHVETKRIYSNALSITVDPLPTTNQKPQAIGEFSSITITAKPGVAKQAEGIVVAIELIGNGDFDAIECTDLVGMPEALRFYASKQLMVEPTKEGELPKKRFEFIVQGLKAGTWEIPPQTFYYFDTKKRSYATLSTMPLPITIMPNAKKVIPISSEHNNAHDQAIEIVDTIAPLHKELALYTPSPESKLPWWFFWILSLMPLLWILYYYGSHILVKKQQDSYQVRRAKKAFAIAKKQLEIIKKNNEPQELYRLFVALFADRWHESVASISASMIDQRLHQAGMDDQERTSWHDFFAHVCACAFSAHKVDENKNLIKKAEQWIQRLEQLL